MPNTGLERTALLEINPPESTGLTETTGEAKPKDIRYLCRHIFADGRRCGSPALKTQNFCYYHYAHRPHLHHQRNDRRRKVGFDLDCLDGLDNHTSVQLALAEVARRIAANTIDPKRAGLLLYALQLVGQSLRNAKTTENAVPVLDVVEDSTWGHLSELEPGRTEPETLNSRLGKPKPFTSYHPPYEIPKELEEAIRLKEGLSEDQPLFGPEPNRNQD